MINSLESDDGARHPGNGAVDRAALARLHVCPAAGEQRQAQCESAYERQQLFHRRPSRLSTVGTWYYPNASDLHHFFDLFVNFSLISD